MYNLSVAFPGTNHDDHARALRAYADVHGRVPETRDRPEDFDYGAVGPAADWSSWVPRAVDTTERQLGVWRDEQTGPTFRTGFLLTATRECGLGRHEDCPGWNKSGRFSLKLTTLDGRQYHEATAVCACRSCGHAARPVGVLAG